jgi:AraC-like DNA-binding protein
MGFSVLDIPFSVIAMAMHNEFARFDTAGGLDGLSLRIVWHVRADRSYDVYTRPASAIRVIAVRTLGGEGEVTFADGQRLICSPDTVLLFRYAEAARYRCSGESWSFWWFECHAENVSVLPMRRLLHVPSREAETDELEDSFRLLRSGDALASSYAALRLQERVGRYVHEWYRRSRPDLLHGSPVQKAIEYMHAHLGRLSVPEIASQVFLGERRFRQVFRQATGRSPKAYYDALRLDHAAHLLQSTPLSVGQISDRLGYANQFHFSRAFRAHYGVTPSGSRQAPLPT